MDRTVCARLQYDGGGDWYANPSSLPNLLTAIRQRTSFKVEKMAARVRLTDDKGGPRCARVDPPAVEWTLG